MNKKIPKNIDDYVDRFPKEVQQLLKKTRLTIKRPHPKLRKRLATAFLRLP